MNTKAQLAVGAIRCAFEQDSVAVTNGNSFANKIIFSNTTSRSVIFIKTVNDDYALLSLPDTVRLGAGQTGSFFVKYLASQDLLRKVGNRIEAIYTAEHRTIKASFDLKVPTAAQLSLSGFSSTVYLDERTNAATLQLLCNNMGYQPADFTFKIRSYPEGLVLQNKAQSIVLRPGSQQMARIELRNILGKNMTPDFKVTVIAAGPDGQVMAIFNATILQLGSYKQMVIGNNMYDPLINNSAAISYWNTNNDYNYFQVSADGSVQLSNSARTDYRLHLNYYTAPFDAAEMYDSRLSYANKHVEVKIGSISDNLDFPVYGQGGEVSAFVDKYNTLSAYYVKRNYLLFSDVNNQLPGADILALHYDFHKETGRVADANYVYSTDPVTGVQTQLANATMEIRLKGKQHLNAEAGFSHESLPDSTSFSGQNGYAAGLHYRTVLGRWDLLADNYYSTAYYSGLRRGALLLDERVNYQISQSWNGFLQYTSIKNKPLYLSDLYFSNSLYNNTQTYALGIGKMWKGVNISLRPYYLTQQLGRQINYTPFDVHSQSLHGELSAMVQFAQQQLMLTVDAGSVNSNNNYLPDRDYYNWRLMANYTNRFAGFSMLMQRNPYYLMEEPNAWQQGRYRRYSFGPNVHFAALGNRLTLYASDYANYNAYIDSWNNSLQGQVSFQMSRTWKIETMANLNTYYMNGRSNFLQTRFSIEKRFIQNNAPGYHKLTLQFFDDGNANGKWDEHEPMVEGVIAQINEVPARSNKKGKIIFTNLSSGNYTLQIIDGQGRNALRPMEISLTHNQKQVVALVRSVLVSGKVEASPDQYAQQRAVVEGIRIVATDAAANTFTTLTDEKGMFSFYLPSGHFKIFIKTEGQDFIVKDPVRVVDVRPPNKYELIFKITDHSRKIDIKEF